jgi:hypothetical protein
VYAARELNGSSSLLAVLAVALTTVTAIDIFAAYCWYDCLLQQPNASAAAADSNCSPNDYLHVMAIFANVKAADRQLPYLTMFLSLVAPLVSTRSTSFDFAAPAEDYLLTLRDSDPTLCEKAFVQLHLVHVALVISKWPE